ncbi:hypothetical protein EDB89DRAFT_1952586 [Lactarius sanguifluus]|nr:hypothetical protein EDB89DRAFT_1952586 [Lactarius sanguifluus]
MCHEALTADNPTYAALRITQRPSWVRNPTSYSDNAVSSLVVAFEDPDGTVARSLLAGKVLFIFGSCATLRKWKQRQPPPRSSKQAIPAQLNTAQPPHSPTPAEEASDEEPTEFFSTPFKVNPLPTPNLAGPSTRSNQDTKGKSDSAGSTQTKATRSNVKRR